MRRKSRLEKAGRQEVAPAGGFFLLSNAYRTVDRRGRCSRAECRHSSGRSGGEQPGWEVLGIRHGFSGSLIALGVTRSGRRAINQLSSFRSFLTHSVTALTIEKVRLGEIERERDGLAQRRERLRRDTGGDRIGSDSRIHENLVSEGFHEV